MIYVSFPGVNADDVQRVGKDEGRQKHALTFFVEYLLKRVCLVGFRIYTHSRAGTLNCFMNFVSSLYLFWFPRSGPNPGKRPKTAFFGVPACLRVRTCTQRPIPFTIFFRSLSLTQSCRPRLDGTIGS